MNQVDWIKSIAPAAYNTSQETGLSYGLMLAQAAQETGWGQRVLSGTNNIFNIKDSPGWTGDVKTFSVGEYINGAWVSQDAQFRVYPSVEESFSDRAVFLQTNKRYAELFTPGVLGNPDAEANALQRAGYATDPAYAKNIMSVLNGPTMQKAIAEVGSFAFAQYTAARAVEANNALQAQLQGPAATTPRGSVPSWPPPR